MSDEMLKVERTMRLPFPANNKKLQCFLAGSPDDADVTFTIQSGGPMNDNVPTRLVVKVTHETDEI